MSCLGLVFDVTGVDGDTSCLFFGSLVDLGVVGEFGTTTFSHSLGDGSCESGLSVIDMTDGTNVDVGLCAGVFGGISVGTAGAGDIEAC